MGCDMCGENKEPFYRAKVEGVAMILCTNCKGAGEDARLIKTEQKTKKGKTPATYTTEPEHKELIQIINKKYSQKIRQAREKLGLKQEQLAQQLAEKTSIIAALESGKHEPDMTLARKLERNLGITLVEQHEEKKMTFRKNEGGPLTIADMIKNRKKK